MTCAEVAALLGVSRRSVYRWAEDGRLAQSDWTLEAIEARRAELVPRPRGPKVQPIRCRLCGATDPALFSKSRCRPSGYTADCKRCNAERVYTDRSLT